MGQQEAFFNKGIRLCSDPQGTLGHIGLMPKCETPGVNAKGDAPVPPRRFDGPLYVANCVAEEYVWMDHCGMAPGGQGLVMESGKPIDRFQLHRRGPPQTIDFDISRFFRESTLAP